MEPKDTIIFKEPITPQTLRIPYDHIKIINDDALLITKDKKFSIFGRNQRNKLSNFDVKFKFSSIEISKSFVIAAVHNKNVRFKLSNNNIVKFSLKCGEIIWAKWISDACFMLVDDMKNVFIFKAKNSDCSHFNFTIPEISAITNKSFYDCIASDDGKWICMTFVNASKKKGTILLFSTIDDISFSYKGNAATIFKNNNDYFLVITEKKNGFIKVFILNLQTISNNSQDWKIIDIQLAEKDNDDYPTKILFSQRLFTIFVFTAKGLMLSIETRTYKHYLTYQIRPFNDIFITKKSVLLLFSSNEEIEKIHEIDFDIRNLFVYLGWFKQLPLTAFCIADMNFHEFSNSQKININDLNRFSNFALDLTDNKKKIVYMLFIQLIRSKNPTQLKDNLSSLITKKRLNEVESIIFNSILIDDIFLKSKILDYAKDMTITKNLADLNRNDVYIAMPLYKQLGLNDEIIALFIENRMFDNIKSFCQEQNININWKNVFRIIISYGTKNVGLFLYFLSEQKSDTYNIDDIISILSENQMELLCINFLFNNSNFNVMNSKYKDLLFKMIIKKKAIWGYFFIKHNYFLNNTESFDKLDFGHPIFKSKINEIFYKDDINLLFSFSYQNFRSYFEKGDMISASKILIRNPKICLIMAQSKNFQQFLISNGKNEIILSIFYVLKTKSISILNLINPDDFPIVCKKCSYPVISVYGNHPNVNYREIKYDDSPLRLLLERNDPELIYDCLSDLKKLITSEKDNLEPFYFVLNNKLLLNHLWIIVDAFNLTNADLLKFVSYWKQINPTLKMPSLLENVEKDYLQKIKYQIVEHKIKKYSNQKIQDLFSIEILKNSSKLFNILKTRKKNFDKYGEDITKFVDLNSKQILVQLPCLFLENTDYFQVSNLKMDISNIGSDAVGEGPVQDMFNKYFEQLSKTKIFDGDKVSILPCSIERFANNEEKIKEIEIIFYGLGVIFLKILIDMRNMRGVNLQDNSFLVNEFHPWFFYALCWKFDFEPKELFKELFFFDPKLRENILNEINECKDISTTISVGESVFKCRERFFRAIHDGFQLKYRPNFHPKIFHEQIEKSRISLISFYESINSISPLSIRYIIFGQQRISPKNFLNRIVFEAYDYVSTSDLSVDKVIDFNNSSQQTKKQAFERAKDIFINLITKLCNDEKQILMKRFLNYVYGSYTLSPLVVDIWKFCFDFSCKSNIMYSFECDRVTKFPMFSSEDELLNIINSTLDNYEVDPTTRDVIPAKKPHDR